MIETKNNIVEKAVLVCVNLGVYDPESSLDELEELARTAGAQIVARVIQNREKPDTATYIGGGRLEEIKDFCKENEVDLLIFDGELTPSQQRNIENFTDIRVIDRTMLILDIFASRAKSNEGKLQVELAQLKYSLPRIGGKGTELSRLGGGIGTRGPGETKLESDRRHIRRKISSLTTQLQNIEQRRNNLRNRRRKDGILTATIVGYTNAGKSTLMNYLTKAGVLAEDKLFATLDPTSRGLDLPDGRRIMLVDTVGLVRRLPHHLVEAFKSTLEEAVFADIILNVCDASSEECNEHLEVTQNLLDALGCSGKPIISIMNKCDKVENIYDLPTIGKVVMISALNGTGIDELLEKIVENLPRTRKTVELLVPYSCGEVVSIFRKDGVVFEEDYRENGIYLKVLADIHLLEKYKEYFIY
ncbi:MAG: GTPase HflX [Clostridia bacterium]|nr:GTPase HflX [Clostridia bacterium]